MAPKQKLPKWLLILRFAPIVTQLVDDIFIELKRKEPVEQDPLFATKMRAAILSDMPGVEPEPLLKRAPQIRRRVRK